MAASHSSREISKTQRTPCARISLKHSRSAGMVELTQVRLKELLKYNKRTGLFVWRVLGKNRRKAWYRKEAGRVNSEGYRRIAIAGKEYRCSRLAWLYCFGSFPAPPLQIDHINGIRDDDRLKNLRIATLTQQQMNSKVRGRSKYRGVSKQREKWLASCCFGSGQRKYLGLFDTEEGAAAAYLRYARPICGEFLKETRESLRIDLK